MYIYGLYNDKIFVKKKMKFPLLRIYILKIVNSDWKNYTCSG